MSEETGCLHPGKRTAVIMLMNRSVIFICEQKGHLVRAVGVGDPRKRLQGWSDGIGQDKRARYRTVFLSLIERDRENYDDGAPRRLLGSIQSHSYHLHVR